MSIASIHISDLIPGQLYRVDAAKGDVVLGWSEESFLSQRRYREGFRKTSDELKGTIGYIRNMGIVLFCGSQFGFTLKDGDGIYYCFLCNEKVIYMPERWACNCVFFDPYSFG